MNERSKTGSEGTHILLVEDDASLREVMVFNLEEAGHAVTACEDGVVALERYDPELFDVVITDLRMPRMNGMALLEALRAVDEDVVVLVITAYGGTTQAVDAMREGAFHYVEKPVNTATLLETVANAIEHRRGVRPPQNPAHRSDFEVAPIITSSPKMSAVLKRVDKIADSNATVLIRGASGTGKELIARAIHARSSRHAMPFVTVNCAAIPPDLLESTLFGHERGAFTGASRAAEGKFRQADGGTIFLDEIAELSPYLQSKLLRVLQGGEVEVVGGRVTRVDTRVIAATHQDLEERLEAGTLRMDLYYRLNVVPIHIPALSDRPEDVPTLTRYFMRQLAPNRTISIDREVDEALLRYSWPGNVRELQNVVERMVLLADGDHLRLEDIPENLRSPRRAAHKGGLPFKLPEDGLDLVALEREIVKAALEKHEGNRSATARYLNIPRHVLLYRLEKFDLK